MAQADIYVATTSFACEVGGIPYNVNEGERVRAGHPLITSNPGNFAPVEDRVDYEWETADDPAPVKRAKPGPKPKSAA